MGFLDGIMGNASVIDASDAKAELALLLLPEEEVEQAFKLIRDLIVFTDRRLMLVDKQGITGSKVNYHSIPYDSITQFSVETAGSFDRDSELKLWIRGSSEPLQKQFKKGTSIKSVARGLAAHCL